MKEINIKNLIIGAGISGLTLAYFLKKDYLIIEKEPTIGGFCRTTRRNGYVWDYAGHFFHFKTEKFKNLFLKKISEKDIVVQKKNTKILYKDSYIDYPFQTNIHQLSKDEFIDCLYDLYNKQEKTTYDNFLDMLYGKFGKAIVEKFLKPYNEKLYAVDLKKLDVDAMGRFFPYANFNDIINNMKNKSQEYYNDTFLYPKDGAETFIDVLKTGLNDNCIKTNEEIKSINIEEKIVITNNYKIKFENLISTISLPTFLNFIGEESLSNKLSYNQVLVFNLGFDKKSSITDVHWIYIPEKEYNYYRIGFYDNILNSDKLSMYIEIGYDKDHKISENEIKKQLELTLINLKKQKIIDDSFTLVNYEAIIMSPAYVHINNDSERLIQELFNKLKEKNIFSIGRYGAWTYCSMEDCMVSAQKLSEELLRSEK